MSSPDYAFAHALLAVMCYRRWHFDPLSSDSVLDRRTPSRDGCPGDAGEYLPLILGQVCLLRRHLTWPCYMRGEQSRSIRITNGM